jgi:LytS/YehU family sensor histidine kinase
VSVSAHREGERLRLIVEDDGVGLQTGAAHREGVGLRNVQDRLHTLYGEAAEFIIGARAGGRGTSVNLVIPLHAH